MNIDQIKDQLRCWGNFWAEKESLQGYASKSQVHRCAEVLKTGIWASSDKFLFNHRADSIYVPDWVEHMDRCVEQLEPEQKAIINRRFIKKVKLRGMEKTHLHHAVITLAALY